MQDNCTQASSKESIYSNMNFIHLRYNWQNLSKKTAGEHLIYLKSGKSWMSWRLRYYMIQAMCYEFCSVRVKMKKEAGGKE